MPPSLPSGAFLSAKLETAVARYLRAHAALHPLSITTASRPPGDPSDLPLLLIAATGLQPAEGLPPSAGAFSLFLELRLYHHPGHRGLRPSAMQGHLARIQSALADLATLRAFTNRATDHADNLDRPADAFHLYDLQPDTSGVLDTTDPSHLLEITAYRATCTGVDLVPASARPTPTYLQPGGSDTYLQPDGSSYYLRPS